MAPGPLEVRALIRDDEIHGAFPLMAQLRDRIDPATFVAEVRRQAIQGYELWGGFDAGRLVVLAGVRRTHTLSRGEHVFVDDLVTVEAERGHGYGTAMLRWLAERAARQGLARIYLDSRATARGFYEQLGFSFMTSIPASIEVETLRAGSSGTSEAQ